MSHLAALIDSIHRRHHLDRERVCAALERGIEAAARKQLVRGEIVAVIDRAEGGVEVSHNGCLLRPEDTLSGGFLSLAGDIAHRELCIAESAALDEYYRPLADAQSMVSGTVLSVTPARVYVRLDTATPDAPEAMLPTSERIPGAVLTPGQSIDAVLIGCQRNRSGTETILTLSRAKPSLVTRTLETIAPAVADGLVKVVRVARAPGYRTKVVLSAVRPDVDALALCAGAHGETLGELSRRLNGESMELIEWTSDAHALAAAALAPAQITEILSLPLTGKLVAIAAPNQQTIARGRRGANLFLASQVVGIDIELRTERDYLAEIAAAEIELVAQLGLSARIANELVAAGIREADDLEYTDADEMVSLAGISRADAEAVIRLAKALRERNPTGLESSRK